MPLLPDYIIWRITESEAELRNGLEHPELFAEKVERLKPGSRRLLEVLAVRRAMKVLFNGEEKAVVYDEHGAPRLADASHHISISHTHEYVAVIASEVPVGIDIERRGNRVQRVTSHFLKHNEVALLRMQSSDDEQFALSMHLAWSAKEAAFKVLGQEYFDLQHLTTVAHIDWLGKLMTLDVERREQSLQMHFDYTDDYVMVWVQI